MLWLQNKPHCCWCSVTQSSLTLCNPKDSSKPCFPVPHYLPEFAQTHVHWVGDVTQPSHPLLPSSSAFNLSQHQGLFQWVHCSHQVARVLDLHLQHQSFQWTFRVDFLQDWLVISLLSKGLSRVFSITIQIINSLALSLLYKTSFQYPSTLWYSVRLKF